MLESVLIGFHCQGGIGFSKRAVKVMLERLLGFFLSKKFFPIKFFIQLYGKFAESCCLISFGRGFSFWCCVEILWRV